MVESVTAYAEWCEEMLAASYPLKISSKINDNLQRQKEILESQTKFVHEQIQLYRVCRCTLCKVVMISNVIRTIWSCEVLPVVQASQIHSNSISPQPSHLLFLILSLVGSTQPLLMMVTRPLSFAASYLLCFLPCVVGTSYFSSDSSAIRQSGSQVSIIIITK